MLSLSRLLVCSSPSARLPPRPAEPTARPPPQGPPPHPHLCVPSAQDVVPGLALCAHSVHPLRPGPLPTHSYTRLMEVSPSSPLPSHGASRSLTQSSTMTLTFAQGPHSLSLHPVLTIPLGGGNGCEHPLCVRNTPAQRPQASLVALGRRPRLPVQCSSLLRSCLCLPHCLGRPRLSAVSAFSQTFANTHSSHDNEAKVPRSLPGVILWIQSPEKTVESL